MSERLAGPAGTRARRRRWPWIVGGVAVLLGILVAVALPLLLDVERHRARIERALSDATGWEATLGEIDLSVLGGLALRVSPAGLAAPGDASSFEVGEINVRAALMPLFGGRLEIRSVELDSTNMMLVRPDLDRGWVLPLPQGGQPSTGSGDKPSAVTIGSIAVRNGSLRLEDRSVAPPLSLTVDDVDIELSPASGGMRGVGAFGGDGGRISWNGSLSEGVEIGLDALSTGTLGPWLGEGILHPGGKLGGEISVGPSTGVEGKLTGESLRVLAGAKELRTSELDFRLVPAPGGWDVDKLELAAGRARLVGQGSLVPLALRIEMPRSPLETALELTDAVLPLGLDVSPPGEAELTARIELSEGGEPVYEARGELSAARFVAADILPEATEVRATFELSSSGRLDLDILNASVGGGRLQGHVTIDSIDPMGTLVFDGGLTGASFGELLGGFLADATRRVTGPTDVNGRVSVDLARPTLDASSIRGQLAIGAADVDMAGWNLESAFREALHDKLGKLAEIAALVDPAAATDHRDEPDPVRRLLDRISADVRLDELPWALPSFELRAGQLSARGKGSFDPVEGSVDLSLNAALDPEPTREYVERHSQLRALVDKQGRLSLPMRLRGPMLRPGIELELSELIPGAGDPEKAIKGLLEGLLDRQRRKKKDD